MNKDEFAMKWPSLTAKNGKIMHLQRKNFGRIDSTCPKGSKGRRIWMNYHNLFKPNQMAFGLVVMLRLFIDCDDPLPRLFHTFYVVFV